jgi:hypothetical protein
MSLVALRFFARGRAVHLLRRQVDQDLRRRTASACQSRENVDPYTLRRKANEAVIERLSARSPQARRSIADCVMPPASRTSIIAPFADSSARSSSSAPPAAESAPGTISSSPAPAASARAGSAARSATRPAAKTSPLPIAAFRISPQAWRWHVATGATPKCCAPSPAWICSSSPTGTRAARCRAAPRPARNCRGPIEGAIRPLPVDRWYTSIKSRNLTESIPPQPRNAVRVGLSLRLSIRPRLRGSETRNKWGYIAFILLLLLSKFTVFPAWSDTDEAGRHPNLNPATRGVIRMGLRDDVLRFGGVKWLAERCTLPGASRHLSPNQDLQRLRREWQSRLAENVQTVPRVFAAMRSPASMCDHRLRACFSEHVLKVPARQDALFESRPCLHVAGGCILSWQMV